MILMALMQLLHLFNAGVWIVNHKICAVCVRCSWYVSTYGLALNFNTDLSCFKHIVPYGLDGKVVTSLSTIFEKNITVNDVLPYFTTFL